MVPARCIRRNLPQVVDGGRRGAPARLGMYLATVSLLTSWPSLASSFAIRRRLQSGFSRAICTTSATTSGASGGRPTRFDFQAQKRAKPRRCHPITVSGFTIASASAHRDQTRERTTQKAVDRAKRRPGPGALEHGELLTEHEDLYDEACARAQAGDERAEQG
jgi:hypothetical protein